IGGGAVDDLLYFLMLVGRRRIFGVDVQIAVADMSEHGHDGVLVDLLDRLFNRDGERLHLVDGEADVGADAGRGHAADFDAGIAHSATCWSAGAGKIRNAARVTTPSVPSVPMNNCLRSVPVLFLMYLRRPLSTVPSASTASSPSTRSRVMP